MSHQKHFNETERSALWMTSSFIADLIAINDPRDMARHLCEQIRELSGAKTVAFFLHEGGGHSKCRPLHVCPDRRMNLFEEDRLADLCPCCGPDPLPLAVADIPLSNPVRPILVESGIDNLLRAPVYSGNVLLGAFMIMDFQTPSFAAEIDSMMHVIGPTVGLAVQNAFVRRENEEYKERLEQQINQRTAELEEANRELASSRLAALNMMEDAILTQKKMEFEQALFRSFMDTLPAAVFFKDVDGRFVSVNRGMAAIFGADPEQLTGKFDADLFPKEQAERKRNDELAVMQSGQILQFDEAALDRYYHTVKAPRVNEAGEMVGIYGVSWDITQRKKAERELGESREYLEAMWGAMDVGIMLIDVTTRKIMKVNPALLKLCGRTEEELIGKCCHQLVCPAEIHSCPVEDLGQPVDRSERILLHKDGREFTVEKSVTPITLHGRKVLVETLVDMTERKEAEQKIADLARFPEENTNPVFRIDRDQQLMYANDAALVLLAGVDVEVGAPISDPWKALTRYAVESGCVTETELQVEDRAYAVSLAPVLERGYVNVYARDISALKEAQKALQVNEEHLRTTLDSIGDAVISTDVTGLVTNMNPVAESLTGWRMDDAMGTPLSEVFRVVNETTRHPMNNPVDIVLASGSIVDLANHALLLTRDGREIPIADSAAPIRNAHNEITGVVLVFRDQATERASRRALEENEARFRNLLESMELIPVQGYNQRREVIYWNAASVRVYGYTQQEALGQRLEELIIPPSDRETVVRVTDAWHAGGDPVPSAECVLQDKQGRPVPVFSSHVMHHTTDGEQEMYCVDVDLRDLKAAENQMRESMALLRTVVDTLPTWVWWKDRDSAFLGMNTACARALGEEDATDLIGKTDYDVHEAEFAEKYVSDEIEVMETGLPKLAYQEPVKRGDRPVIWLETNKVPLRGPEGQVIGTVGIATDITPRKAAEVELQRLSTAIEQSPEAIVITDTEGIVQYTNPAFEEITGYARDEVEGEKPSVLKSGEHDDTFYAELWETISSGRVWEGQLVNKKKDGTLFTEEASIAPVKDANGGIINYVAIKRDITKELEREEEFRQSQKMEAIGLLAGGVAHDFNNILQAIMGFSELLILDLEEDSLSQQNALEIRQSATRAAGLTKQLLAFSRKQPVASRPMDMNDAVHDAEALIAILLGEQYHLELDLEEALPEIKADSGQLTQVIMNLAVNARDAMSEGGTSTISTDQVELSRRDTSMPDSHPGWFVRLSISDTGSGMDERTISRLFEPFFTTKELGKGTGLGLSVVYGIMKQCGGWVGVQSEVGWGSTFELYFPADGRPLEPEAGDMGMRHKNPMDVLVVDDDPDLLTLIVEILVASEYGVVAVGTMREAIERFEMEADRFDLLLADIQLPDGDGIELANRLRSSHPDLPVLLCSGVDDPAERAESAGIAHYHFIQKPFSAMRLLSAIQETTMKSSAGKEL